MNKINIPVGAAEILARLQENGEKAYVVGGCVRDSMMGRAPHDWDICTSAKPERVKKILQGYRIIDTGLKHGTVTVLNEEGETYEVTTFRIDGWYTDGRRPDSVIFVRRVSEDLERRDFTINAMAYNDVEGLIDPFGGVDDIGHGCIRCVGNPGTRFYEDALRILRAVRFSAQLGFSIARETADTMRRTMDQLGHISAERIGSEFKKVVCAPYATYAICESKPILCKIIPELAPLIGCQQNNKYHKADVFGHTMEALHNAETCDRFPKEWADEYVRIALFFHDFGKPDSKTTDEAGYDHFYGHAPVSAEIAEQVMRRLRFSNQEIETITELIANHDVEFSPTKACARRMLNKFGYDQLKRLLKIRECDNRSHAEAAYQRFEERAVPFAAMLDEVLAEQSAFSLKDLAISGKDIVALGVKPGPIVGELLTEALDAVVEEVVPNEKGALVAFVRRALDD